MNDQDPYQPPGEPEPMEDPEHLSLTHLMLLALTFVFLFVMLALSSVMGRLIVQATMSAGTQSVG